MGLVSMLSQSSALLFPRECKRLNPRIRAVRDRVPERALQLAARSVSVQVGPLAKVPKSRAFTIVQEAAPAFVRAV